MKTKKAKTPRIPRGKFDVTDISIACIMNRLMNEYKFTLDDLGSAVIEKDYESCIYDTIEISVTVEWG